MEGRIMHFRDFAMTLDNRQLRADEASYNMDTRRLELRGNVSITLPNGPAGFYKINPR
jgi:lipopolysaccharide assembly outer membrane protein LptD (OstA)